MKTMNKQNKESKLSVREITPKSMKCGIGPCPAVFLTNRNTFILIGKKIKNSSTPKSVKKKIASDETTIEVPKKLITKLFK